MVGCGLQSLRWGENVKRVNLIDYFDLSEQLGRAKSACSAKQSKAGSIYFSVFLLNNKLNAFIDDDNGFSTSKHPARDLADAIDVWVLDNVMDDSSPPGIEVQKFDVDLPNWSYGRLADKVDEFRNVFTAECREVEVYSVGQVSIYRTTSLVANGSHRIPPEYRADIPEEALKEFDSAGKCLAFDLPTACGFHALRAVELMILKYLKAFDAKTEGLKTWFDYVKAVEEAKCEGRPPSKKVAQMLDRMRDLDRNPLMHPRDTLDVTQADMLFSLAAITVVEMARDMEQREKEAAQEASTNALVSAIAKERPAKKRNAEKQKVEG
jgi:hypothetical protein